MVNFFRYDCYDFDLEIVDQLSNKLLNMEGRHKIMQLPVITTVFVDTRLSKTKHPRKRFQNFRQSCMLPTDRIEIHQSQPASMM